MADNNLARSRNDGPDFFADGDPLAELARIVGYEERVIAKPEPLVSPSVVAERREPVFNLEDELLREFERYDAPRLDPADDLGPADAFAAPSHEPRVFQAAPALPPVAEEPDFALPTQDGVTHSAVTEPVVEEPLFDAAQFEADLGALDAEPQQAFVDGDVAWNDEYPASETYYADTAVEEAFADAAVQHEPAPVFTGAHANLPVGMPQVQPEAIAPLAYEAPQAAAVESLDLASELETSVAVPAEPLPVQDVKRKAAAFTPSFRMPLANFQSGAGVVSQPRVEPKVEPVAVAPVNAESLSFDGWTAPAAPVVPIAAAPVAAASISSGLSMPVTGIPMAGPAEPIAVKPQPAAQPLAEPVQAKAQFSELDELLYDVDRYSSKAKVEAPVAAPAVAAPTVAATTQKPAAPLVDDVADPFADAEFELALDDLELDLADMVGEENRKGVTPAPVSIQPTVASAQSFASVQSLAAAPVQQPTASVATTTAAHAAPVAAAPVAAAMSAAPAYAAAQPQSQPAVAEPEDDVPFDPALIAESDEQPEAIAELDVPVLTVEEKEEAPLYRNDFDLDIDAELASLLEAPEPAAQQRAATAPQIAAAAAAAAPVAGVQAPAGQPAGQNVYADLDDFERALEEDFRRSLATPLAANEAYAGEQSYEQIEDEGRASPKRWIASLAAVGLVAIVGGGAYVWLSGTGPGAGANGEPVVIAADSDPVKVAPANPGGKTVPNQDKAVYDRVAGNAAETPRQQQLISSSEEPVDVVQRTLMPDTMPLEGENDMQLTDVADTSDARLLPQDGQADAQSGDPQQVMVMPRRVKTMIVRADGTLVEQEIEVPATAATGDKVAAAPARADAAAATAPQSAAPFPTAQTQSQAPAQQSAGIVPVSAPADVAAASAMPEAAQAPAAIEQLANPAPASAARAPVPTSRPSQQPVNVVASVSDQGNVRPAAAPAAQNTQVASAPAAATPAAAAAGGYVIQIASLPSEADAQRSYQNLSNKFGSVIGGRGVDIKAAEIAGKGTFYRVRIPAGANRAEAVALCERYRSAGGSCLVAR